MDLTNFLNNRNTNFQMLQILILEEVRPFIFKNMDFHFLQIKNQKSSKNQNLKN